MRPADAVAAVDGASGLRCGIVAQAMLPFDVALFLIGFAPARRLPVERGRPIVIGTLLAHGLAARIARNSATWRVQSDGPPRFALLPVHPQTQRTN